MGIFTDIFDLNSNGKIDAWEAALGLMACGCAMNAAANDLDEKDFDDMNLDDMDFETDSDDFDSESDFNDGFDSLFSDDDF